MSKFDIHTPQAVAMMERADKERLIHTVEILMARDRSREAVVQHFQHRLIACVLASGGKIELTEAILEAAKLHQVRVEREGSTETLTTEDAKPEVEQ